MKALLLASLFGALSLNASATEIKKITVMANVSKCIGVNNGEPNLGLYLGTPEFEVELDTVNGTEVTITKALETKEDGEIKTEVVLTKKGLLVLVGEYIKDGKILATSFFRQTPIQDKGFISAFSGCTEADTGKYLMNLYYNVEK